jgi:hypothetical protein
MELVWDRPVIVFYKERLGKPFRKAFAVVKTKKFVISKKEEKPEFDGFIKDFFPLMGDIDSISSKEGTSDRYVLCWFDNKEDDFNKSWRRLTGVTFPKGVSFIEGEKGKRTYNTKFSAIKGKLN